MPVKKQTAKAIQAALALAKDDEAKEIQKQAVLAAHEDGYQQGWADCSNKLILESKAVPAEVEPISRNWFQRLLD